MIIAFIFFLNNILFKAEFPVVNNETFYEKWYLFIEFQKWWKRFW